MVGLSVVLEKAGQKGGGVSEKNPQVINKVTMMKPSSSSSSSSNKNYNFSSSSSSDHHYYYSLLPSSGSFLDYCFLCKQKLLPGNDIYMYKGDKAFCSVECRYRQIFMDEEETLKKENCSLTTMKPRSNVSSPSPPPSSASASASAPAQAQAQAQAQSPSSSSRTNRKGARNRANRFAYGSIKGV